MSTSTTAASSSIPSFYTMDGTTRLNGSEFASGLDTQNLIKALTAKTSEKIDAQKQLQQKAQWKQDMFHAVEDLLQKFSDSYLSYSTSSPTNLMSRSFFDSEQLVSSASSIVTATGNASDAGNVVINKIDQLASAAVYTGSAVSIPDIHATEALGNTVSGSSYFNLNVSGVNYTVSLGAITQGSGVDITTNGDGTVASTSVQSIADKLNGVLQSIKVDNTTLSLHDKVSFSADNGVLTMNKVDQTATITGASQNFIDGFGMAVTRDSNGNITSCSLGTSAASSSIASLSTQLSGTTLTVQLDGLSKTISFNQSESAQFATADSLESYLQGKLNDAYGSGKITVNHDDGGVLTFKTTDPTSVLSFASSSDSGVLGTGGLLHIRSGESNRLESDKTLDELAGELNTPLVSGIRGTDGLSTYSFTINGKEFTFEGNTELNTVINTINNDQTAGVTVSYSQTLNQFRIVSDSTGSQGAVNIYDNAGGGNFAAALFGGNTQIDSGAVNTQSAGTSNYSISINGGAAVLLSVTNTANESLADLEKSVQDSVTADPSLNGKITVGISTDGKSLTFRSADGTPLTMASTGSPDILGLGTGKTTATVKAGGDCKLNATVGGTAMDINRETNSFTLDGVSLNITGETTSKVTFSAADNTDDLYKKISDFVDSYNKIIDLVNTDVTQMPSSNSTSNGGGTAYEPLTDDQKKTMTDTEITQWNTKAQQGLLFSDPQLSSLQTDIRKAMENSVSSVGMSLSDVGITTQMYDYTSGGKLVINTDQLKTAIKDHPDQLEQLFTNSDGIASRLNDVVTKNIGAYGNDGTLVDVAGSSTLIGTDNSQLAKEINSYSDNIKTLQDQLKTEQDNLQAKFTTMESIISRLSDQYNSISNMGAGS